MSEYAFLLAKIRGKLARMVELPVYEDLLKSADLETVLDRLRETMYGPYLAEAPELERLTDRLRQGFFSDISSLLLSLDRADRGLLGDVLARYRIENIKTIIRGYLHRLPPEEVKKKLLALPWESFDYERLLRLPGLDSLIKELPWREERAHLEAVHGQVGEAENPFPYEAELDALYLKRLIGHWRWREEGVKRILGNRLLKETLTWAYRLKGYGRSFPEIINILPDFRPLLPLEELQAILEEEEGWRRLRRWLSATLARELEGTERFDLDLLTKLFDEQLLLSIRKALIVEPLGIAIVLGYTYWKELELARLIGLLERARVRL